MDLTNLKNDLINLKIESYEDILETIQKGFVGNDTYLFNEYIALVLGNMINPACLKLAGDYSYKNLLLKSCKTVKEYVEVFKDKLNEKVLKSLIKHESEIEQKLNSFVNRFNYLAIESIKGLYLLKEEDKIETPAQMYMRVCLFLFDNLDEAFEVFDSLEKQLISLASPILFNAGTKTPKMISCSLHFNKGDSRKDTMDSLVQLSGHSSDASGIGYCISNLRSSKSKFGIHNGKAHGVKKLAKVCNDLALMYNQGGKRKGSWAIYLDVWHKDIFEFLELKLNFGSEENRARDLFYAVNYPDNFWKAVEEDGDYYLFCPHDLKINGIKPFYEIYGEEFEKEYDKAVKLGLGEKVKARNILKNVTNSILECGVPYTHNIDITNKHSNHSHYGKIKSSNLCIEVMQYTDSNTVAQCVLSAVVLQNIVKKGKVDFKLLRKAVTSIVKVLNRVIDLNEYSSIEAKSGSKAQRSIGIGVIGLADCFAKLNLIFDSQEAKKLNKEIFENIYFAALKESNNLAKIKYLTLMNELGAKYPKFDLNEYNDSYVWCYERFKESKYGNDTLHFDTFDDIELSIDKEEWNDLRSQIKKFGLINSLVTACMPTATTSTLFDCNECFEPFSGNIYLRRLLSGEKRVINKYLYDDLVKYNICNENLLNLIRANQDGSIQNIDFQKYGLSVKDEFHLKQKYRTVWEYSQKDLIDICADRSPFIDQSQSMNLYSTKSSRDIISSMLFYSWKKGLKTGSYYVRTKAKTTANQNLGLRLNEEILPEKPKDSPFDCVGCNV